MNVITNYLSHTYYYTYTANLYYIEWTYNMAVSAGFGAIAIIIHGTVGPNTNRVELFYFYSAKWDKSDGA